jgi:hypothetical protein
MYADTSNFVSEFVVVLLASSTVRAFGGALPPPRPSGDFCAAVRSPYDGLSLVVETQRRSASPHALRIYHPGP